VKFTNSGGVVRISGQCTDQEYVITVADNGIGISDDDLSRVLQPFVQANNALNRHHEGAGLGLTLVKSIIEKHGGSLRLESQPGHGTKVHLVFPGARIGVAATLPRKVASR
jgi:signal transduction histidine kinase